MPKICSSRHDHLHRLPANLVFVLLATYILVSAQNEVTGVVGLATTSKNFNSNVYLVQLKGPSVVGQYGAPSKPANPFEVDTDLVSPSHAASSYADTLIKSHDQVLRRILSNTGGYRKLYSMVQVVNGFAVLLRNPLVQVQLLSESSSVVRIEIDQPVRKSTTHSTQFMGLTGSSGTWNLTGATGENIIIGLVDTGVVPGHPSFTDNVTVPYGPIPSGWSGTCNVTTDFPAGSCNLKLIGARFFADGMIASGYFDPLYDFASPADGDGHGCHTLSTAGGNGGVNITVQNMNFGIASGTAPRARLAMYKAVFRDGGVVSDVVAAIDQAVADGCQVLSLSLALTSPPPGISFFGIFDIALLFAVKAGVAVIQAAGNGGPTIGTTNSLSPWILSTGAGSTDRNYPVYVNLGNNKTIIGAGLTGPIANYTQLISWQDAVLNGTTVYAPCDCQDPTAFNATLVTGKILLCNFTDDFEYGSATIQSVAQTVQSLNATGFILLTLEQSLSPVYFDPIPFGVPGAFVTDYSSSTTLYAYYTNNTVRVAGVFVNTTATAGISVNTTNNCQATYGAVAPVVQGFSGRGPPLGNSDTGAAADVLKPDILAPGWEIWGAWTPIGIDDPGFNGASFALLSGTSMSAPHVAGVTAILKQLYPSWSPAAIRSAIVTTGSLLGSNGQKIQAQNPVTNPSAPTGFVGAAAPFDMGGGEIKPTAATNPGLIFDAGFQDYINFLCAVPGSSSSQVQAATNISCNTTSVWASDLNMPYITIVKLQGSRNATRVVTSVASFNETYTAKISMASTVTVTVSPMSFTIRPNQTASFKVTLKVISARNPQFAFGSITWTGTAGHIVNLPLAVYPYSLH